MLCCFFESVAKCNYALEWGDVTVCGNGCPVEAMRVEIEKQKQPDHSDGELASSSKAPSEPSVSEAGPIFESQEHLTHAVKAAFKFVRDSHSEVSRGNVLIEDTGAAPVRFAHSPPPPPPPQ